MNNFVNNNGGISLIRMTFRITIYSENPCAHEASDNQCN